MLKRLSLLALASVMLASGTSNNIALLPFGPWQLCPALPWACASTTTNQYVLSYKGSVAGATNYSYTINASFKASDGTVASMVVTGTFARNDNSWGFSSTFVTIPGTLIPENTTVDIQSFVLVGDETANLGLTPSQQ